MMQHFSHWWISIVFSRFLNEFPKWRCLYQIEGILMRRVRFFFQIFIFFLFSGFRWNPPLGNEFLYFWQRNLNRIYSVTVNVWYGETPVRKRVVTSFFWLVWWCSPGQLFNISSVTRQFRPFDAYPPRFPHGCHFAVRPNPRKSLSFT